MKGTLNFPSNLKITSALFLFLLIFPIFSCHALGRYANTKSFEILDSAVTCDLDVTRDIASISVKVLEVVNYKKSGIYFYAMDFNPSFIDGKGVYSSTLIDYEVSRVTRNGEEELFQVLTKKNGQKFIEIYSKDGAELEIGEHLYVVWYKARNKVVPGVEIQSFNYLINRGFPIKNLDLAVHLGSNISFTNTAFKPPNESYVVRGNSSYIRVQNSKEYTSNGHTEFTINFKENRKVRQTFDVATLSTNKHIPTNIFILFLARNIQRIDFIIALVLAVISLGTLLWHIRQLCKKS